MLASMIGAILIASGCVPKTIIIRAVAWSMLLASME